MAKEFIGPSIGEIGTPSARGSLRCFKCSWGESDVEIPIRKIQDRVTEHLRSCVGPIVRLHENLIHATILVKEGNYLSGYDLSKNDQLNEFSYSELGVEI